MTADLLLAVWAVFWGAIFARKASKPGWFDATDVIALLALVAFPVLCVHAARSWP